VLVRTGLAYEHKFFVDWPKIENAFYGGNRKKQLPVLVRIPAGASLCAITGSDFIFSS
jgi:hypothetical protein